MVGGKILIRKDGILRKAESRYIGPYTISQVHTNGTIRVQHGTSSERINIRHVTPYNQTKLMMIGMLWCHKPLKVTLSKKKLKLDNILEKKINILPNS